MYKDMIKTNKWELDFDEIPSEEQLGAKIKVLEERISRKNEKLLEKELILEELTKLLEKYWKSALENWEQTLIDNQKLNEIKSKT